MKEEILRLKREKNAVILAHHYQSLAVKEVADFVGDSLELSKIASKVDESRILLCGVHFMAETAKILAPQKRVFLPNKEAGCPMADMVTAERLAEMKMQYPEAVVVTYVNSSAEVKAISDICCTSSNAVKIVNSIDAKQILFVPDQNLGQYVQSLCPDKEIVLWRGFCPTHHRVTAQEVDARMAEFSGAVLFAHPECRPEVLSRADFIGSTAQIITACEESGAMEIVIGTEQGVVDTLRLKHPEKTFHLLDDAMVCKNMKKTTLEDIYYTLSEDRGEIFVDETVSKNAYGAIHRMMERS